ncbi:HMG domain-containing protein 4 HMG box-containing protein 4 [Larimichthys crocea]|uniref:HMG domain-containing protein 4 HMG box-containing protein 4 n=1 Tax=Larimichthys crocea TaxID=215358 RepID=A0A6G0J8G4_LARCR|nr:HMG domain-containing protein 4 HMG box-containing protein 4 [Larimichthys crocea]
MSQQTDEEAEAEWGSAKRDGGAESEPDGAEPSTFLPVYPDGWRIRGEEDLQEDLLHPCCPAEGNIDQNRHPSELSAHLHLLGESLSLIGHHLQETDKMVSVPGSLSLLLDSLLCALAPLICLTTEIPELRSCTQHTLGTMWSSGAAEQYGRA